MCWTQARSALFFGGTPQKARGSATHCVGAPVLQAERRVGDDHVELAQGAVAVPELRVTEGVAAQDLEVLDVVEVEVHAGDRRGGEVHLLAVEPQRPDVPAVVPDLADRLDEHPARPAGRVVDRLAGLRVEELHEQPDDGPGREELAGLLARLVGELAQQVLVRRAEQVVGHGLRVEGRAGRRCRRG